MAPILSHQRTAAFGCEIPNSVRRLCTQMTSAVALARALYSASVLDLDTVACFLALHEIRLEPRKIAKPHVDFLSSEHPAQSALEKALTKLDRDGTMRRPKSTVPLIYLKILLTAVK